VYTGSAAEGCLRIAYKPKHIVNHKERYWCR